MGLTYIQPITLSKQDWVQRGLNGFPVCCCNDFWAPSALLSGSKQAESVVFDSCLHPCRRA